MVTRELGSTVQEPARPPLTFSWLLLRKVMNAMTLTPSSFQVQTDSDKCLWTSSVNMDPCMEPSGLTRTRTCVMPLTQSTNFVWVPCLPSTKSSRPTCLPSFHMVATDCLRLFWLSSPKRNTARPRKVGLFCRRVSPAAFEPSSQSLDVVTMTCSLYSFAQSSGETQKATAASPGPILMSPGCAEKLNLASKSRVPSACLLRRTPWRLATAGSSCTRFRSAMVPALESQSPRVSS
mmetsp:Transcript_104506/g.312067  ORF Transcript_104506/g.312067 Transcript_104506/m.312067 type:complete len:235 (+) Transcript_104506:951-1655(+)